MRTLKIFILAILLPVFSLSAQEAKKPKIPIERFSVSVLANVSSFYLDGRYKIFESPMAFGIAYSGKYYPVETGLYISPVVIKNEGGEDVKLGIIWHSQLFKAIGAGFGYNFWDDGVGLVGARKDNLFIVVSINVGK